MMTIHSCKSPASGSTPSPPAAALKFSELIGLYRTGRFLHALGNVRESQGMLVESLAYHERALRQYESTIGKNHHRTGDVHVRIADHLLRDRHLEEARYETPLNTQIAQ